MAPTTVTTIVLILFALGVFALTAYAWLGAWNLMVPRTAVVQDEDLRVTRRVESGAGARLARVAAKDRLPDRRQLRKVRRTPDQDRSIDRRMRGVSVVRPSPHGLAREGEGELVAAEAGAAPGAEDCGDDAQTRRPPPRRGMRPPGISSPSTSAKIILPRSVWMTWVTVTSTISLRCGPPFSTTTMVPSSR